MKRITLKCHERTGEGNAKVMVGEIENFPILESLDEIEDLLTDPYGPETKDEFVAAFNSGWRVMGQRKLKTPKAKAPLTSQVKVFANVPKDKQNEILAKAKELGLL
jgi:hypothetical protein